MIEIIEISEIACDDGVAFMYVQFETQNIFEPGISVYINEELVQQLEADAVGAEISDYESEAAMLLVEVCQTTDIVTCCDSISIENPCYTNGIADNILGDVIWESNFRAGKLTNETHERVLFELLSYDGIRLLHGSLGSNEFKEIDLNEFATGLYLLHLRTKEGQRVIKIIVQ